MGGGICVNEWKVAERENGFLNAPWIADILPFLGGDAGDSLHICSGIWET